jgi:hypothetical protein
MNIIVASNIKAHLSFLKLVTRPISFYIGPYHYGQSTRRLSAGHNIAVSDLMKSLHPSSDNGETLPVNACNSTIMAINHEHDQLSCDEIKIMVLNIRNNSNLDNSASKLLSLLEKKLDHIVSIDIHSFKTIMLGLEGRSCFDPSVNRFLQVVVSKVSNDGSDMLSFSDIADILYSMNNMDSSIPVVTDILKIVSRHLTHAIKTTQTDNVPTPDMIARAMYGLRHMSSRRSEVQSIVNGISYLMERESERKKASYTADNLTRIMEGMEDFRNKLTSERRLIQLVVERIRLCGDFFHGDMMSRCLRSVRRFDSSSHEVRQLLELLADRVDSHSSMTPEEIGDAFFGLQRITGPVSLSAILSVLATKLNYIKPENFTGRIFARILFGIKGVHLGDHDYYESSITVKNVAHRILSILSNKLLLYNKYHQLHQSDMNWTAFDVASCLFGCHKFHTTGAFGKTVLQLIERLEPGIQSCRESLSVEQIGLALYGMRNKGSEFPEVQKVIAAITENILRTQHKPSIPLDSPYLTYDTQIPSTKPHAEFDAVALKRAVGVRGDYPAVFFLGFAGLSTKHVFVQTLIRSVEPYIEDSLQRALNSNILPRTVARCFFSLKDICPMQAPAVLPIVDALRRYMIACKKPFSVREICMAMSGMQSFSCNSREIILLLREFISRLEATTNDEVLCAYDICYGLFGLRSMIPNHTAFLVQPTTVSPPIELLHLYSLLTSKLKECPDDDFTPCNISRGFRGVTSMSSEYPEIRTLITTLLEKTKNVPPEYWTLNHVVLCTHGIRGKNIKHKEVASYLDFLNKRINYLGDNVSAELVSNYGYALVGMTDDSLEVRETLGILLKILKSDNSPLRQDFDDNGVTHREIVVNIIKGLEGKKGESREVRELMEILLPHFEHISASKVFGPQGVATIMNSFNFMNSKSPFVRKMLSLITPHITIETNREHTNITLSQSCHGLRRMSSDDIEVRETLKILANRIRQRRYNFRKHQIVLAWNGLRRMNSKYEEVCNMIEAMGSVMSENLDRFDFATVCNILSCMRLMSTEQEDVRRVVRILVGKYDGGDNSLDSSHLYPETLCDALDGMRRMSIEECTHIRAILHEIHLRIASSNEFFSISSLCIGLSGLRNMSTDYPEVVKVVASISSKMELLDDASIAQSDPRQIANAFVGLRLMSSDFAEVENVLQHLYRALILTSNQHQFSSNVLAQIMAGMRNMNSNSNIVIQIVSLISEKLSTIECYLSSEDVNMFLLGLQGMNSNHKEIRHFINVLSKKIKVNSVSLSDVDLSLLQELSELNEGHKEVKELFKLLQQPQ